MLGRGWGLPAGPQSSGQIYPTTPGDSHHFQRARAEPATAGRQRLCGCADRAPVTCSGAVQEGSLDPWAPQSGAGCVHPVSQGSCASAGRGGGPWTAVIWEGAAAQRPQSRRLAQGGRGDSARGGGGRGLAGGWAGLHGDPWRERSVWRAAGVKAEVRRSGPGQKPSPLKLQPEEGVGEGGRGVESCFLHTRCRQPLGGQAQEPGCLSSPSLC